MVSVEWLRSFKEAFITHGDYELGALAALRSQCEMSTSKPFTPTAEVSSEWTESSLEAIGGCEHFLVPRHA